MSTTKWFLEFLSKQNALESPYFKVVRHGDELSIFPRSCLVENNDLFKDDSTIHLRNMEVLK